MSIASIESSRLRKVENRLGFRDQKKAIGLEESDEHVLLGDLIRFVENSDKSLPIRGTYGSFGCSPEHVDRRDGQTTRE